MKSFSLFYKEVEGNEGSKCHYTTRLDTYGCGCQHDCKYCYAKSLLDFRGLLYRAIGSSLVGKYVDGFIFTFIGLSFLPLSTKLIMVANCPFIQVCLETLLFPITSLVVKKVKKAENIQ